MYVPSSEYRLSRPLSLKRVCPPPRNQRVGAHSPAGEGVGEFKFGRLEKKPSTLSTLWRELWIHKRRHSLSSLSLVKFLWYAGRRRWSLRRAWSEGRPLYPNTTRSSWPPWQNRRKMRSLSGSSHTLVAHTPAVNYSCCCLLHCKKRLLIFPSPAGMPLTKLSLAGNY